MCFELSIRVDAKMCNRRTLLEIKVMVSKVIKVLLPCLQSVNPLSQWFPTSFVCEPVLLSKTIPQFVCFLKRPTLEKILEDKHNSVKENSFFPLILHLATP